MPMRVQICRGLDPAPKPQPGRWITSTPSAKALTAFPAYRRSFARCGQLRLRKPPERVPRQPSAVGRQRLLQFHERNHVRMRDRQH